MDLFEVALGIIDTVRASLRGFPAIAAGKSLRFDERISGR
jgi:hypothetical protein